MRKAVTILLIGIFVVFSLIQSIPNYSADTQSGFILASAGKDGQFGTNDDVMATASQPAVKGSPANIFTTNAVPSAGEKKMQVAGQKVAGGPYHSLTLKNDGTVWAWGRNDFGELGNGTTTSRYTPVQVKGLTNVVAIAAGYDHSLALRSDGTVWAWGLNGNGQLGDGTTTNRTTPVQVKGLTNVVAIAAGVYHSLAIRSDGTVWTWGYNTYGQLGDGTTTNKTTPVQVKGLTNVVAIAAGVYHSLALICQVMGQLGG